jgi:hypothetical protein
VEAWVNLDASAPAPFLPILARWDGSYELDVSAATGKANFVVRNSAAEFALVESAEPMGRGEWHHVAGVFDAGIATVWVDGVRGTSADISASGTDLQDAGDTLFIGSTRDGTAFVWKGLIDEVAVYDRALDESRIRAHTDAAEGACREEPDAVSIDGPPTVEAGDEAHLVSTMVGVDAGGYASYAWTLVSGVATLHYEAGDVLGVTGTDPGEVVVRVAAGDGVCDDPASAEFRLLVVERAARFRRGDADGSGKLDLTDAIFTLLYLFLGGRAPDCFDAADADDSGAIDLTDAIGSLQFQFLGGVILPDPGPVDCGPDTTPQGPTQEPFPHCVYTKC